MHYFLEDFIQASNACRSPEELFRLFQSNIERLGFTSAVYTFVSDHDFIGQKAGHGVQFSYPQDWMNHYLAQGYQHIDPVISEVFNARNAFTWESLGIHRELTQIQQTMFNEARESGLVEGVGVPLHGIRGEVAGLGLASTSRDIYHDRNTLSLLQVLGSQFHLAYCQMHSGKKQPEISLSQRETDILQWMSLGKTMAETALILGCGVDNVKYHVKQIYRKLEVNSKALAITKAVQMGLITLDRINLS